MGYFHLLVCYEITISISLLHFQRRASLLHLVHFMNSAPENGFFLLYPSLSAVAITDGKFVSVVRNSFVHSAVNGTAESSARKL